ncbi:hypothetical protein BZA05DRAFT_477959 [Tricharina praecox]|uniref:uncharacterized protein n=1 Tax=Tricharina praecox TaxID=43433 RepID=UPI00221FCAEA|nr:uncharacterized protein BZA05DRAFT_477959 [Tricharina praecox]KAI5840884.1 hypothetical protein BZA05DRAFT_477959 [Tricharina praecox]
MAAASYYGAGTPADQNKLNAPTSPVDSPVGDTNKPLPPPHQSSFPPTHQNTFPPTHVDAGYNDDLSPTKYNSDPFSDNIPLHETGHKNQPPSTQFQQPPMSHVENGGSQYPPYPPPPTDGEKRKKSWRSRPWFVYFMTLVHTIVFCVELGRNQALQGSPISTKPYFQSQIGPSTDVMINMGRALRTVFPCPSRTDDLLNCTLAQWCGFNGRDIPEPMGGKGPADSKPDQWYRFIIPMFYHAGLIHLAFNMFMQVTLGGEMELEIGVVRFIIVYFCSGIFGFVLGGNLGAVGQPSV